jgi:tetratricopeptide (TPR) repeat protein
MPGALELTTVLEDFLATTRMNTSAASSRKQQQQPYDDTYDDALSGASDDSFVRGEALHYSLEHDPNDSLEDPYLSRQPRQAASQRSPRSREVDYVRRDGRLSPHRTPPSSRRSKGNKGSPGGHDDEAPSDEYSVSPLQVLENIQVRARRRRQLQQHLYQSVDEVSVPSTLNDSLYQEPLLSIDAPPPSIDSTPLPTTRRPPTSPTRSPESSPQRAKLVAATAYWNSRLRASLMLHGPHALLSADAWMQLGNAYVKALEYDEADRAFGAALRIYRLRQKRVAMARALNHQGTAKSRAAPGDAVAQQVAGDLLQQAYAIREQAFGPQHVDSVATLNALAWVHVYAGRMEEASHAFWKVFWTRQAIFGPSHPAVAVTAHDLATSFGRLQRSEDAHNFYSIALQIYDELGVPSKNPAVQRLFRDMERLDRVKVASKSQRRKMNAGRGVV